MHSDPVQEATGSTISSPIHASALGIRLRGAIVAAICAAAVGLASWLSPRVAGYGTHLELGLPACSFLVRYHYPCPTCGMTTSMANMAHGRIAAAWHAQPFGVAMFVAAVVLGVLGAVELASAYPVLTAIRPRWWWIPTALAALLAAWGWKIADGLMRGQLPL